MFKFDLLPSTVYTMKLLGAKKEKNGGKLSKVSGIRCTAMLFFCSLCCIQLLSWEEFHMKCLYEVNRSQNQSELQIETVKPESLVRMLCRIQQSEYWQLAWRVVGESCGVTTYRQRGPVTGYICKGHENKQRIFPALWVWPGLLSRPQHSEEDGLCDGGCDGLRVPPLECVSRLRTGGWTSGLIASGS